MSEPVDLARVRRERAEAEWLGYEPAPVEYSLAQARHVLELLYGRPLERRPELEAGICDDCRGAHLRRVRFGRLALCVRCANSRERVAGELAS